MRVYGCIERTVCVSPQVYHNARRRFRWCCSPTQQSHSQVTRCSEQTSCWSHSQTTSCQHHRCPLQVLSWTPLSLRSPFVTYGNVNRACQFDTVETSESDERWPIRAMCNFECFFFKKKHGAVGEVLRNYDAVNFPPENIIVDASIKEFDMSTHSQGLKAVATLWTWNQTHVHAARRPFP